MEASHAVYEQLAGGAGRGDDRLDGYVFADRDGWADYTRRTAGDVAAVYLLIGRGGYAHERAFATFYFGGPQTLETCRHEGFHQYVAATFRRRPPPFLEEGLATLFEAGFDGDDASQPRMNGLRHREFVAAFRGGRLLPLAELLTLNAGHVAGADGAAIDAFYAQAWALARFLMTDPSYRDGLRTLLRGYAEDAAGDAADDERLRRAFGVSPDRLADDFAAYERDLAGAD